MDFNYTLDQGQPHAGPRCAGMKFLKLAEELPLVARIDAQPIVAYIEYRFVADSLHTDLDSWRGLVSHKLHRIVNEVLKDLGQAWSITMEQQRDLVQADLHPPLNDLTGHGIQSRSN